ncbi:MAG: DAK2 domain-containing protein [Candidatus Enteromonas sp.]|nr:DAK2 domain-containing protein [Candidatus Enteromonas sp.]MDY6093846.1 DAK2 domain-containing protein [Candidatus Enteromonas sp.]
MKRLDAKTLKRMLISGANHLYNHYPEVDQLNVFPVPDGDTGMNMNLTVTSGVKEIQNIPEDDDLFRLGNGFSRGLLMGARGNSGVITSQIFKGFSVALKDKKSLTAHDFAAAFVSAKEVAYKAVMKPVEGTILTVIRESSSALMEFVQSSTTIEEAMEYLVQQARIALEHTPDLLPVLKEVGVVDSGGAGLVYILEGMLSALKGKVIERNQDVGQVPTETNASLYAGAKLSEDEEGYGYCTQFILRLGTPGQDGKKPFVEKNFKGFLAKHGKSLVTVRDEDIIKVHVHTLTPGNMLNYAQQFGEFLTIIIENMSEEHHNIEHGNVATDMASNIARGKQEKTAEQPVEEEVEETISIEKEFGLVAVSSGKGLDELFRELGADVIVGGGQTMNPSTEDFVRAIKKTHARNVFLLPNNSNIVMAASQACDVMEGTGVTAIVIPSKTIPQGIVSAMNYAPEGEVSCIAEEMKGALKTVASGSVTYAVRDTDIDGVHVTKDYYMAMMDKSIVSCVKDRSQALLDLIDNLITEDSYMVTVLVGSDVDDQEASKMEDAIREKYGDQADVDVKRGDQPVYSYLVGVE